MTIKTTVLAATAATALAAAALPAQPRDRVEVGQEAPDFALESSTGETYELSSMRGKSKVLLVFFRGTW